MLTVLNWKLTLLALVVCLSETQCAPPGTPTTSVELELICNETIAAVSPQDCKSCPVKGCETKLLQAGCWKDSDHWYKSCMGELGPCLKIRWEKNNDGSYSNSECRAKCRGLHETCSFMPVVLTTTPEAPSYAPVKPAPTDTSKIDDDVIAAVVCSIAVVLIVALVLLVFKYRPDLLQRIKDFISPPETLVPDMNDPPGQPPQIPEAEILHHQQNEGNEGFEDDPTVTSPLLPTTPPHSSSSIPVDTSGAGPSTASSSSRHPTLEANVSSTLESENLLSDQQDSAETPVTRLEDNNPRLETVHSDNVDEFAAPSHEEQIAPEIDQWNASGSKATISAVAEGATETNKSEEIGYQNKVEKMALLLMDEDRNEESRRLDEAAGGSPSVDQHATNSGGVKPSEPLEPIITVTVPGGTQKDASTGAPTPQDGSPNSSGSLVQPGTKTDDEGRNDESRRLDQAAGGSPPEDTDSSIADASTSDSGDGGSGDIGSGDGRSGDGRSGDGGSGDSGSGDRGSGDGGSSDGGSSDGGSGDGGSSDGGSGDGGSGDGGSAESGSWA